MADHPALDNPKIGWGIKWEYSRLEKHHRFQKVHEVVPHLEGSHVRVGPKLAIIIRDNCPGDCNVTPAIGTIVGSDSDLTVLGAWQELDREDGAWSTESDHGIGLKAEDGWYGGKVRFSATLHAESKEPSGFKITLEPLVIGRSTSFGMSALKEHSHLMDSLPFFRQAVPFIPSPLSR